MQNLTKGIAVAAGAISLACCATNEGGYRTSSAVEARLMGMNEAEVATLLGAPTEQVALAGGMKSWTYRSGADDYDVTAGRCTVALTIQGGKVITAKVTARDRSFISFPLGSCSSIIGRLN
jgi:outer membrane protein assembly factor BamE (lipoprotein component of BamABCDE complex)